MKTGNFAGGASPSRRPADISGFRNVNGLPERKRSAEGGRPYIRVADPAKLSGAQPTFFTTFCSVTGNPCVLALTCALNIVRYN